MSRSTGPQYLVRAGIADALQLERGTRRSSNGFGFSVQSAGGKTAEQLARGGRFPHAIISVSTVARIEAVGALVKWPTPGGGDNHATVVVPDPPPAGIFAALATAFTHRQNPFRFIHVRRGQG